MSIATATAEIRAGRRLTKIGDDPAIWTVLSTDGSYRHVVTWSDALDDAVCETCRERYGVGRCWARMRVLDQLKVNARTTKET